MDKQNEVTLNLRFAEINISKYSQYDLENDYEKEKTPLVEFKSNFGFKVIEEEEKIVCLVTVKIIIIETGEEYAELKVENVFEIQPLNIVIKSKSNDSYDIPDSILNNLVFLSISTVRGILSEKLKGTVAQKEIYPLMDTSSLFKKKK